MSARSRKTVARHAWIKATLRRLMDVDKPDWEDSTSDTSAILGRGGDTFFETSHDGVFMLIGDSDLLTPRQIGKVKAARVSKADK
jgi:hypothetical protein